MRAGDIFVSEQQSVIQNGRQSSVWNPALLGASSRVIRALALIIQGLWLLWLSADAGAATFRVTRTWDSGPGSLEQALLDASSNPGPDTILLTDVSGEIRPSSFPIVGDLIITGPGSRHLTIIAPRVEIDATETVTISGVRLMPAQPLPINTQGGTIYNSGTLFLQTGLSKNNLLDIFFASDDYYEGQVRQYYKRFLFRSPTSAEMGAATQQYKLTGDFEQMQITILATNEYIGI